MEELNLDESTQENGGLVDASKTDTIGERTTESIIEVLDAFLSTPRFSNDVCIILNMPENMLKKNKEKLNAGIWHVYNRYAKEFGMSMLDILIAVETMVDAVKLSAMLDNDIKLCLAKERSIVISETELEKVVSMKGKLDVEEELPPVIDDGESDDESEFDDEAEIMEGLI